MKTTKTNHSLLHTLIVFCVCLIFSFTPTGFSAYGEVPVYSSDSSSIINFYNPAGSFFYQPKENIHANEHEMKAGLLYDLESKKIVWQKDMNTPYPIASLTKMMVALLTVEDIHAGKINWTDRVRWTRDIIVGKGKKKHITKEEINYSLIDLFKAAMIASNNEAAEQIARYVGGEIPVFVDRMNTRARELSMNSTFYGNPTGLPAISKVFDNSATPVDLLILTLEMLRYDEILRVTGMGYADISNGGTTSVIRNHNHLTIDYKGEVDGMKTGYTKRAGFCLVATSNKCEHRLISIVLGSRSPELRNTVVKDMINDYYCSIGLDKLGPFCEAPANLAAAAPVSGDFVYRKKAVKQTHIVKRGEDLAAIAYQYNCSVADIRSWNGLRKGRLVPGKKLNIVSVITEKIPVTGSEEEEAQASGEMQSSSAGTSQHEVQTAQTVAETKTKTTAVVQPKSKYIIYVVQRGDTLASIAKRYDISNVAQLKAVNKIPKGRLLRVGAKIRVPVSG
jgi:D-alanyl-D-alanine carboxypeptidase